MLRSSILLWTLVAYPSVIFKHLAFGAKYRVLFISKIRETYVDGQY